MADITLTPLYNELLTVPQQVSSNNSYTFFVPFNLTNLMVEPAITSFNASISQQIQADGTTVGGPIPVAFATNPSIQPGLNGNSNLTGTVIIPSLAASTQAVVLSLAIAINLDLVPGTSNHSISVVKFADTVTNPSAGGYNAIINMESDNYVATPQAAYVSSTVNYPPSQSAGASGNSPGSATEPSFGIKRDVTVHVPISIAPSQSPSPTPTYLGIYFTLQLVFGQAF